MTQWSTTFGLFRSLAADSKSGSRDFLDLIHFRVRNSPKWSLSKTLVKKFKILATVSKFLELNKELSSKNHHIYVQKLKKLQKLIKSLKTPKNPSKILQISWKESFWRGLSNEKGPGNIHELFVNFDKLCQQKRIWWRIVKSHTNIVNKKFLVIKMPKFWIG